MDRIVQASERERKAIFTETSAIIKIPVRNDREGFLGMLDLELSFFFT